MTEQITKLGRYNVLGVLGSGAMGCVFEGVDPNKKTPTRTRRDFELKHIPQLDFSTPTS